MLDLQITVDGDKIVIEGLDRLAVMIPTAIKRALTRIATGSHRESHALLSGPGGAGKEVRRDYVGFTKKSGEDVIFRSFEGAGGYPVPVRSGLLRDSLDFLFPGQSKTAGKALTFTAGPDEAVIYDSAEYARVIREGTGSSSKYGPRDYLTDGFEKFNTGARAVRIVEEEIGKEIPR